MTDEQLTKLIEEVSQEQQLSVFADLDSISNYLKEGAYFINDVVGVEVDYSTDLNARSLLKNYVLYANHKRLAEWKELYQGDYIKLQEYYYINSELP